MRLYPSKQQLHRHVARKDAQFGSLYKTTITVQTNANTDNYFFYCITLLKHAFMDITTTLFRRFVRHGWVALLCGLCALLPSAMSAQTYNPGDIAVMNAIIDAHPELGWAKADPSGNTYAQLKRWFGKYARQFNLPLITVLSQQLKSHTAMGAIF
jgi:hypothetical protein